MNYCLNQIESAKIREHFGQAFYQKLLCDLEIYSEKWGLEILQLVDYFSINCIFICRSENHGRTVLKIGKPSKYIFTEISALKEYGSNKFCKIYESDAQNGIMLIEQINPGTRLREEKSLAERLSIFSSLYNGLHIESANPEYYPSYDYWVSRITDYMSAQKDFKELYLLMKKANDVCKKIANDYNRKMLLHGDFHHDNILKNALGWYTIIDPKGVIGDPVFDICRFILNEYDDSLTISENSEKTILIIDILSKRLSLPAKVIKQCYFIEAALANCWNVESNMTPDLDCVNMAESLLE